MTRKVKHQKKLYLPWMMSIEEFRKTGDFENWSNAAIKSAINTLAKLTILTFELQTKKPKK
jgi:hypothetical protein